MSTESSDEAKLQNELLILMKCQLLSGSYLRITLKLRRLVNCRPGRRLKRALLVTRGRTMVNGVKIVNLKRVLTDSNIART